MYGIALSNKNVVFTTVLAVDFGPFTSHGKIAAAQPTVAAECKIVG
jgi:hypothetical protein